MSEMFDPAHADIGDLVYFDDGRVGFLFSYAGDLVLLEAIPGQETARPLAIPYYDPSLRVMEQERMRELRKALSTPLHVRDRALSPQGRRTVAGWGSEFYPGQLTIWPTAPAVEVFRRVVKDLGLDEVEIQIGFYLVFGRFDDPEFLGEDEPAAA